MWVVEAMMRAPWVNNENGSGSDSSSDSESLFCLHNGFYLEA